uniref:Uncharacterized protein n=1 Tax=Euplotes crassus TaxID=5936 RepID=A0A7S3KQX4_EUPCR|mmetsp:Transcript_36393/g.36016  ORF Transcript_36393/g.36016 Transcript_36393/m.36016 type:complete len:136 (+) Transcript_36393:269-676(+)
MKHVPIEIHAKKISPRHEFVTLESQKMSYNGSPSKSSTHNYNLLNVGVFEMPQSDLHKEYVSFIAEESLPHIDGNKKSYFRVPKYKPHSKKSSKEREGRALSKLSLKNDRDSSLPAVPSIGSSKGHKNFSVESQL